jgi:dCTP deaminase
MTVLSEFRILGSWCKGEARFYEGSAVPPELDSCIALVRKTTAPPRSQDVANLRDLVKKYEQCQGRKNDAPDRVLRMQKIAGGGTLTDLMFDDFDLDSLGGMVYDLRVGTEAYISSGKNTIRLGQEAGKKDIVTIRPGDFAIIMTLEYVALPPDLMGFISVRMRYKRQGLVNISGFHVDPGFHGRIMFAVYNAGPKNLALRYKDRVFMMLFANVEDGLPTPGGPNMGQTSIPADVISDLSGPSVSPRSLDERLSRLEQIFYIVAIPTVITVVGVVIAFLLGMR